MPIFHIRQSIHDMKVKNWTDSTNVHCSKFCKCICHLLLGSHECYAITRIAQWNSKCANFLCYYCFFFVCVRVFFYLVYMNVILFGSRHAKSARQDTPNGNVWCIVCVQCAVCSVCACVASANEVEKNKNSKGKTNRRRTETQRVREAGRKQKMATIPFYCSCICCTQLSFMMHAKNLYNTIKYLKFSVRTTCNIMQCNAAQSIILFLHSVQMCKNLHKTLLLKVTNRKKNT